MYTCSIHTRLELAEETNISTNKFVKTLNCGFETLKSKEIEYSVPVRLDMKVVYIAPLKALVRERVKDWKVRLEQRLGKHVVELTGDVVPDSQAIASADIIVTTPEKWDGVSRSWQTRQFVRSVALIVIDEIHLLGDDRGPVLEVIVSRTNFISSNTDKKVSTISKNAAEGT